MLAYDHEDFRQVVEAFISGKVAYLHESFLI